MVRRAAILSFCLYNSVLYAWLSTGIFLISHGYSTRHPRTISHFVFFHLFPYLGCIGRLYASNHFPSIMRYTFLYICHIPFLSFGLFPYTSRSCHVRSLLPVRYSRKMLSKVRRRTRWNLFWKHQNISQAQPRWDTWMRSLPWTWRLAGPEYLRSRPSEGLTGQTQEGSGSPYRLTLRLV